MWLILAILGAFFAALTSIFAKLGIQGINSDLAVAIRTLVVLAFSWAIVFTTGRLAGLSELTQRNWVFLVLSGLATGLSWLFSYRALQIGQVSRVIPVDRLSLVLTLILAFLVLGEPPSPKALAGGGFIVIGVILIALA